MPADNLMPREKALKYGISSLNNNELLALVLKTAYKDYDVFKLSENIIMAAGGFSGLLSLEYEELINIKGIKKAKALEIMAILEIVRRLNEISDVDLNRADTPEKIAEWIRYNIAFSHEEEFFVIFVSTKGEIISAVPMFKGSRNATTIGIDTIIRKAILLKASSIVISHNHPSDNLRPSHMDIKITRQLNEALKLVNIALWDHLIVGSHDFFSFKNKGLL